jgi:hypothetical protein
MNTVTGGTARALLIAATLAGLVPHAAWAQQNPFQTLQNALNQAKQQLQQSTSKAPATGTAPSASPPAATPTTAAPAATNATTTTAPAAAGAGVFVPPTDAPSKPAGPLVPAKLMDIGGIHIGMPIADTVPILKQLHPGTPPQPQANSPDEPMSAYQVSWGAQHPPPDDNIWVNYTFDTLTVFAVFRAVGYEPQISKTTLIDALRKKYGPETAALDGNYPPKTDDDITKMWWLSDEQGNVVHPANLSKTSSTPYGCPSNAGYGYDVTSNYRSSFRNIQSGKLPPETYCDSIVTLYVELDNGSSAGRADSTLVSHSRSGLFDNALLRRSTIAWAHHQDTQAQQKQQQSLQKANQAKPNL